MFRLLRIAALIAAVFATGAFGQTVSVKDGNVFFTGKDGGTIQITSSGLDSPPS